MIFKFDNVYLKDSVVVGGTLEKEGPLGKYFDSIDDCKDSSFENSEIDILSKAIDILLEKNNIKDKDIDLAVGGELSNQLTTTSYTFRRLSIPLIGIYSACSTISLAIGLASVLVEAKTCKNVLAFTSSHNQSAERQFRNPVEYGGDKSDTQTFTSTVGASCIISKDKSKIRINSFTLGEVVDVGFTNSLDFGRAMAPAALETLFKHFKEFNKTPKDYDLILTGDLSRFGSKIVKDELEKEFGPIYNYNDCGLLLYDISKQNVFAGGSGPGTSAAVLLGYIRKEIELRRYNKVLLCATGALMNPTMINQKNSIPCIAHIIDLEVVR